MQYQAVLGSGDEIQRVVPDRHGLDQAVRFRGQGNNGKFGAAMQDFFVGHFRIEELNIQCDRRITSGELAQQRWQAMQANMVACRQGEAPADLSGQVGQGASGVVKHVENLVGPRQQGASSLGQADLAAQTVEQPYVELLLKPGDAFADGRLRQMQAFAGPGEAPRLGNGNKCIEVGEVHGVEFLLVIQSIKIMNLSYSI
ncbi:hypothetical protein D3C80_1485490 [compost metagenome]